MTSTSLPAVALAAVPGRRARTLELAREIERRGFAGIYCASFGDAMALCEALAFSTGRIPFGTAIANLYTRHPADYASHAAFIHEVSGGRFRFGVGVSHDAMNRRLGLQTGRPLGDMREFVETVRGTPRVGELPPLVVAGLRKKMVGLAGEIGDGVVFANASRSHMEASLGALPKEKREDPDFFIGDMIPTCICDDREAAAAVNRKTLTMYVQLPNYRRYWKEAGYVEEMEAIEKALEAGDRGSLTEHLSDRWLADATLFGSAAEVREGVEAWREAGVRTPIVVPSSASGGQFQAFEELFAAYA
ncbi:MAG: LLM class flavin-dependent oxidoreductase [Myxococcota bacterium]|nr:LLM class flavin-dependent oxidoreductase [Myxococcota bacterium]